MRRTWFVIVIGTLIAAADARAADHFVRAGASGAKDGSSWTNAWPELDAINYGAVACGDTIWVAGGTYTHDLSPAKKCSSGARLTITRARADAPAATGAAGWSASFAATVHQTGGAGILFDGDWDYVTISGRTTAAGGGNGWWIDLSGRTGGNGIELVNGAGADYNVVEYMDLQGPGYVTYTSDGRGIDATPFSTATGNRFSHLKIWGWESGVYLAGIANTTFEYIEMYDIAAVNSATYHPNGIYTSGADGLTVRYSRFHDGPVAGIGEGIFCEQSGGCANWLIYGNVFYDLSSKVIQITSSVNGAKIINNTFAKVSYTPIEIRGDQGGACSGASETTNNLAFSSSAYDVCGTGSNNLTTSTSPFVSVATKDYHIVSTVGAGYPRNAGANRSAIISTDPDGGAYGGDGAWDIGAYEYGSVAPTAPPAPPTNLRVTVQ